MKENTVNRNYKDRLFRLVFQKKKDLLQLYNAVNGTEYTNEKDLVINTLEDVVYLYMKNDLSFLFSGYQNVYEHQSTFKPNMPLRGFLYIGQLFQGLIDSGELDLYGSKLAKLPAPQYVVFYNGTQEQPDRMELKLSAAFEPADKNRAEVTDVVLTEYDEERHIANEKRSSREEGREEGLKAGRSEGLKVGEQRMNELIRHMLAEKRFSDLERAASDSEYREQLFKEYGL